MQRYDIILFGATSFVGEILTRYMQENYPVGGRIKWAIAGRSEGKLSKLKASLGDAAANLDIIVANTDDDESIEALVTSTKVVISTVGPYALYGEVVVKACVAHGTDYCDLTGEPQWIKEMVTRYEDIAKISGARIVHSCGFDSIPSDLGVFFLQENAKLQFDEYCSSIKMRVKSMKGAASGGTVASMMNMIKEASSDRELRKLLSDPYALCPSDHPFTVKQTNLMTPAYDKDMQTWIAPFVMAAINIRIIHRSNSLLGNQYGNDFLYDEAMMTGKSILGGMGAAAFSAGMGGFMLAAVIPPSRWLMEKTVLPKPGEGPSQKQQLEGRYDLRFVGKTKNGQELRCKVTGDRDPGYGSTAKMLGESAMCLLEDISKEDKAGGFWTPASVFGMHIVQRLEKYAGLSFTLQQE
ncbi:saccharopine dehydrogenase family protein [Glaciecola petra]|uniref:Saccharopine dehydrogenase NADP-binding domain-containing protein n=1 Tax=Glaciecola petra TaxID=3075602 RepID=A0ABU2ZND4_9ALTE|nr:saccharopine dehydrogenase NADP-binding domain-containing protein [Aestuariibacter sp. P117]MDT0594135.1 saccharopine dehydrogenase NADP-binding domain-containing protein [Aestuariibacter sp. P117]